MLHLNAASSFGLRRDDLIVKDGDMFAVEDRLTDYERWRAEREQLVEQGKTPSVRVQTATAWAAEAAESGIDEAIAAASAGRGRLRSPAPKDGREGRGSARSSTPCWPSSRSTRERRGHPPDGGGAGTRSSATRVRRWPPRRTWSAPSCGTS